MTPQFSFQAAWRTVSLPLSPPETFLKAGVRSKQYEFVVTWDTRHKFSRQVDACKVVRKQIEAKDLKINLPTMAVHITKPLCRLALQFTLNVDVLHVFIEVHWQNSVGMLDQNQCY